MGDARSGLVSLYPLGILRWSVAGCGQQSHMLVSVGVDFGILLRAFPSPPQAILPRADIVISPKNREPQKMNPQPYHM